MADPRRLREILGFGYGAPSPAMSALEPFHAGVDPAYMPQDVVTESPWEGPREWVRSGLGSLFGAMAPNERVASQAAEKVTNLSDWINPAQAGWDIGQEAGNTLQGGDPRMLAMSLIPGKAAEGATKVVKELDLPAAVKEAQKLIVRDKGSNIGSDALAGLTREGHYYRGMTDAEFNATLGSGKGVKSSGDYSHSSEGTSFAGDAPTAESYVNYGRDDPRKTGKPNYLVEVRAGENIEPKPDGYYHAREGLSPEQVQRVWRMEDNDGALVAVPHDLVPAVKAAQKGIRAYHGTPHDFEKFSLDKIGTGEGAQAYGHGLYFAENEGIARGYRDNISDSQDPLANMNMAIERLNDPQTGYPKKRLTPEFLAEQLGTNPNYRSISFLKDDPDALRDFHAVLQGHNSDGTVTDEAIRAMRRIESNPNIPQKSKGHMYEVNINADPDAFLDWDKPLSEQHEKVRGLASQYDITGGKSFTYGELQKEFYRPIQDLTKGTGIGRAAFGNDTISQTVLDSILEKKMDPNVLLDGLRQERPEAVDKVRDIIDAYQRKHQPSGEDIYHNLFSQRETTELEDWADSFAGKSRANVEAAERLKKAGIPGIKYLDAGSRGAGGEGSRNYVVFSDEIIDIVKKYGIAGALGAGLITQQMADQLEAQQGGGQS